MSALIAEIPRQTHPMFVDKRDVRANNGFATGELDDFNEDVLSGKLAANYNGRRCYEYVAEMHGSRGASIGWAARNCGLPSLKDAPFGFAFCHALRPCVTGRASTSSFE
jgi:hypothetical protein